MDLYYTRNSYAIYFDVEGGSYVEPMLLLYGTPIEAPEEPERIGYIFEQWEPELPETMPAEDVHVSAQWTSETEAQYTIIYWLEAANSKDYQYIGSSVDEAEVGTLPVLAEELKATDLPAGVSLPSTGHYDRNNYFSYNQEKTDAENTNEIANDGTTMVNVYFNRTEFTFAFYLNRNDIYHPDFQGHNKFGEYYHLEDAAGNKYVSTESIGEFPETPNAANGDGLYTFTGKLGENIESKWPKLVSSVEDNPFPRRQISFVAYVYNESHAPIKVHPATKYLSAYQIGVTKPGEIVNVALYADFVNDFAEIPFIRMYQDIGGGDNYTESEPGYFSPYKQSGDEYQFELVPDTVAGFAAPRPDVIFYDYAEGDEIHPVYAEYDRLKYTLTFSVDGTTVKTIDDVWYQENLSKFSDYVPKIPTDKSGYEFAGWYSNPLCLDEQKVVLEETTMPVGGLVLHAKWQPQTFNVNFDPLNDQDDPFTQQVETAQYATGPEAPTKAGYDFVGWREAGKKVNFMFSNPIYKTTDLVAVWAPKTDITYTVNYLDENGDPLKEAKSVEENRMGDTVTEQAEVIEKYLPDKVSKSIVVEPQDNEINFHYVPFETVDYDVSYLESETGKTLTTQKQVTTEESIATERFKRISGYYPHQYQITMQLSQDPSENKMEFIYYKNTERTYTISHFKQNITGVGYTLAEPETELSAPAGSTVEAKVNSYTGFHYNENDSMSSATLSDDGSTKLELYYDRDEFEVQFNAGANGSLEGNTWYTSVLYDSPFSSAVSVPKPIADDGYLFDGWTPALPADGHLITENMRFTANFVRDDSQWAAVAYNANGGTGTMVPSGPRLIGKLYQISGNAFSRGGHTFTGWRTAPTGGTFHAANSSFILSGNVTLYAQWQENTVPVTPVTPPVDPPIPPIVVPPVIGPVVTDEAEPEVEEVEEAEVVEIEDAIIPEAEVPLAAPEAGTWALLNLILTIGGTLLAVVWVVGLFRRNKQTEVVQDVEMQDEYYEEKDTRNRKIFRILGIVTAIISIVVFLLTQDMTLKMAFADKWSFLSVALLVVQIVFGILMREPKADDEEDLDAYEI